MLEAIVRLSAPYNAKTRQHDTECALLLAVSPCYCCFWTTINQTIRTIIAAFTINLDKPLSTVIESLLTSLPSATMADRWMSTSYVSSLEPRSNLNRSCWWSLTHITTGSPQRSLNDGFRYGTYPQCHSRDALGCSTDFGGISGGPTSILSTLIFADHHFQCWLFLLITFYVSWAATLSLLLILAALSEYYPPSLNFVSQYLLFFNR